MDEGKGAERSILKHGYLLLFFAKDDGGYYTRHPTAKSEDKGNGKGSAAFVAHGKGRKQKTKKDAKTTHAGGGSRVKGYGSGVNPIKPVLYSAI